MLIQIGSYRNKDALSARSDDEVAIKKMVTTVKSYLALNVLKLLHLNKNKQCNKILSNSPTYSSQKVLLRALIHILFFVLIFTQDDCID